MGARESFDSGAPKRIDGDGTTALINAAAKAGVQQFVLVSSIGTGKLGFPAGVLNLFWGVLLFKREAEKALEASGMAYCIVRPGEARAGLAAGSHVLRARNCWRRHNVAPTAAGAGPRRGSRTACSL